MSKHIVLTGATGFLGSHLCRALIQRGHTVLAYRRSTSDLTRVGDVAHLVRWHCLPDEWEAPFCQEHIPDAVIHCAALYGRKGESAAEMIEVNTLLPVRLLTQAAARGVPVFFNTDTVLQPTLNAYALSKHHAVEWLQIARGRMRVLNLKVQHFYGPDDDHNKFVTSIIVQCLANVPEIPLTDGRQRRDFIYVEDVVSAFLTLLAAEMHRGAGDASAGFSQYEIGSGEAVEVRKFVERIHQLTHSRSRLLFAALPHRPGEPMLTQADTTAMRALGWRTQVPLEEGLKRTIAAVTQKMQAA